MTTPLQPGYGYPPGYGYLPPPPPRMVSPGGAPLAEFVDRLVARIIDGAILGGAAAVVIVPIYLIVISSIIRNAQAGVASYAGPPNQVSAPDLAAAIAPVLGLFVFAFVFGWALAYVYEVEMMFRSGQTVGKRVMKIRVIAVDPTRPLTRMLAAKRFLVQQGCSLVPGLSWLDGLWQLWDQPYRQCLHDKFATTLVIKLNP